MKQKTCNRKEKKRSAPPPARHNSNKNRQLANPTATSGASAAWEAARAKRSAVRDALIQFVNGLSISDIASVKAQASMLATVTGETKELSRDSSDMVTNQCIRLTNSLAAFAAKSSVQDLMHATAGVMATMAQIQGGVNDALAGRAHVLQSDVDKANALPKEFDADLENYWTNPNNFKGGSQ